MSECPNASNCSHGMKKNESTKNRSIADPHTYPPQLRPSSFMLHQCRISGAHHNPLGPSLALFNLQHAHQPAFVARLCSKRAMHPVHREIE